MKDQDICFVIVTYKPNRKILSRLMAAISEYRVIAIDNTKNNIGYGAAANQGMKRTFEAGASWVVVVNQDVMLTKAGITKFVRALEHRKLGIVGPEAGGLDPKRWTTILQEKAYELHKATPCKSQGSGLGDLAYISGSLMAIHRKVWEATGGFYEQYFMYYEDADLCVRARRAGFVLMQVEIEGFGHGSRQSRQKEYYLARNHLLFVWRLAPLAVKLHEILRLPKTILETLWSSG